MSGGIIIPVFGIFFFFIYNENSLLEIQVIVFFKLHEALRKHKSLPRLDHAPVMNGPTLKLLDH